ncbi:MAG: hypothetical protein J1G06_09730 [Oscillospiraceae bacterium]|nr:hypothetical protein [Oscillospiraceae bacterium]
MTNKSWTTLDDEWVNAVAAVPDISFRGTEIENVRGMRGRGEWQIRQSEAEYTHTDGVTYNFTKSFCGGSGSDESRCFYFIPEGMCVITVVYASKPGRPVKIYHKGKVVASGTKGRTDGRAAVISADIPDNDGEPVYIFGGSCNKDIYGIFVDYYTPETAPERKPEPPKAYLPEAELEDIEKEPIPEEPIEFTDTIEVGADKQYKTIQDAVNSVKRMIRPEGESGRVTIVIDAGVYPKPLVIDAPYVTLKAADMNNRPVIQWHYALGYVYYSAHNGFYDEQYAAAKRSKGTVEMWGPVCRITGEHVKIDGCVFKNTFNCEVTDEERADGCEAAKYNEYIDVNEKPERTAPDYDPMAKSATERAAAIAIDADHAELYNSDFISSQDTFYVNGIAYVKDCYIEGVTDYIFGGSSAVFKNCTLAWHGYTDLAMGGYISASKTAEKYAGEPDKRSNGFLFKDCVITTSKYYPDNVFTPGAWGRNWGGEKSHAVFDGITVKGIDPPVGWYELGGSLEGSVMYVNDVTDQNGCAVDVSGKEHNPNGTMSENGYKIMSIKDYI